MARPSFSRSGGRVGEGMPSTEEAGEPSIYLAIKILDGAPEPANS
ncbi:hypothetical protein [Streptomyces sp. 150FB]|nr:hypothetical protein [Streptomyces sp. 150FB]